MVPPPQRSHALVVLNHVYLGLKNVDGVARLSEARDRLLGQISRLRAAVTLLQNRVPPKILRDIFARCCEPLIQVPPCHFRRSTPWTLLQVCSRWRQVAFGEPRLWNAINFEELGRCVPTLEFVYNRCTQSPIRLHVAGEGKDESFMRDVILPRSRQIEELTFNVTTPSLRKFLCLPPGHFENLEVPTFLASSFDLNEHGVLREAANLRRFKMLSSFPPDVPPLPSFPLPLGLPWAQLTHLDLTPFPVHVPVAHELITRCCNLQHCCLRLWDVLGNSGPIGQSPTTAQSDNASLKELCLFVGRESTPDLFRYFLQNLSLPAIEEINFDLKDGKEWSPVDLAAVVNNLSHPKIRSKVTYKVFSDIEDVAELSFVTAIDCSFVSRFMMDMIARGEYFPKLAWLSIYMRYQDVENFIAMLKARWAEGLCVQDPNDYKGIEYAFIGCVGSGDSGAQEIKRKVYVVQEELGVEDFCFELRCS